VLQKSDVPVTMEDAGQQAETKEYQLKNSYFSVKNA